MKSLGIYIHIPFCMSKCPYCDFYSKVCGIKGIDEDLKERFIDSLILEIRDFCGKNKGKYEVNTIYFGGGTPNLLNNKDFNKIFKAIYEGFDIESDKNIEKTMEFNPKIWNFDTKIENFNRISIGAQSFNNETLKFLGRIHKSSDIKESFNRIKESISNISLDLMFGIPLEKEEDFINSLREAIALNPTHISLYSLEFMEGTKFTKLLEEGKISETESALDRKIYHESINLLKENGYIQYEISNFSKEGFSSKHNLKYWNMDEYIGFGPSSHSLINKKRFSNPSDLDKYLENPLVHNMYEELSIDDEISEYTFTALRKNEGINLKEFKDRFNVDFWDHFKDSKLKWNEFKKNGYVIEDDEHIKLTVEGFDISNKIFVLFI